MDHQVKRVLLALCRQVGTPRSLTVATLCASGEWTQLQELRVRPSDYLHAEAYFADAVVTEFLRKCELPGDKDRKYKEAVKTFWACETQNARTNARLSRFIHQGPFGASDERVISFVNLWRKEIRLLLGRLPNGLTPRFSGGATYADKALAATPPDKMTNRATYYLSTAELLPYFWQSAWGRASTSNNPRVVRGNVFFTVPKDGTKDRGCCKEASIAVALQLDVGLQIKQRLEAYGVNLRSGQDLHRKLAQQASLDHRSATLDLSNASDTVALNLVRLLLPWDWFQLLNSLRAPATLIGGKWVRLEKFSSMGNGFTFELESVLFLTLARVISNHYGLLPETVSCYGDDLIVPTETALDVMSALRFFGFTPNPRKSFFEGDFRESCGGDFFSGEPVRAHYLEKLPDSPQQWISLANGLRRLPAKWSHNAWMECLKNIPSQILQCRGPESLGDLVLHDDPKFWKPIERLPKQEEVPCLYYRAWVPVPTVLSWKHWKPSIQYASALLGLPSSGVTPRGVSGYRLGWVREPGSSWLPQSMSTD
jgi:hypothetical protein